MGAFDSLWLGFSVALQPAVGLATKEMVCCPGLSGAALAGQDDKRCQHLFKW